MKRQMSVSQLRLTIQRLSNAAMNVTFFGQQKTRLFRAGYMIDIVYLILVAGARNHREFTVKCLI